MNRKVRIGLAVALLAQFLGLPPQPVLAYEGNYAVELGGNGDFLVCDRCGDAVFSAASLTVEAWIKWNGEYDETLHWSGGIVGHQVAYQIRIENGPNLRFVFADQGADQANEAGNVVLSSDRVLVAHTWYHVAATYRQTSPTTATAALYLNGSNIASLETTGSDGQIDELPDRDFEAGVWQNYGTYFPGTIDEVRVSNIVRYWTDFPVPTAAFNSDASTLALYHFDENRGASASDATGRQNLLTFQGAPIWVDASDNTTLVTPPNNISPQPLEFIKPDWVGLEPDWADFGDDSYTLYWKDQDADDNASITLFYDNDTSYSNGVLGIIASGLNEDDDEGWTDYVWNTGQIAEGSYEWDTSAVPNGAYYVGAEIADEDRSVVSYAEGKVWVYHFPQVAGAYESAGLASLRGAEYADNPELIHRVVFYYWDELEPCGDDNYLWEVNPSSGRYYQDYDGDGVCGADEGPTFNRFKEEFLERLYQKVEPDCQSNCEFKQPLELLSPQARVYLQINGLGPETLVLNDVSGQYEKGPFWMFDEIALLRTPDGDYNVNGRAYPSVQFWAPNYKADYQDLLEDYAAELKNYPEIYPYVSLVRAQFNAFNEEAGFSTDGYDGNWCAAFETTDECVDYTFNHESYDPETRYNVSLAKEYYLDEDNVQHYYYREANDYHEWVGDTYFNIFKNDPDGKLRTEIAMKFYPTDTYFTPPTVYDAFAYEMVYEYGVWFYQANTVASGFGQVNGLTSLVHDQRIARGLSAQSKTYDLQSNNNPQNLIPARYDNPLQWVYWHGLMDLHRGVEMTSLSADVVAGCVPGADDRYCGAFEFLNRYAGSYFSPTASPGAWIAFRPLFHPQYLSGNYEMYMTQLDADNTALRLFGYDSCAGDPDCDAWVDLNPPAPDSLDCEQEDCPEDGYFGSERNGRVVNLGPKSQPYGLWARSIGAEGKEAITLDLQGDFVQSLCEDQPLQVRVIYLDTGGDTFAVNYKNQAGVVQTITVDKGTSGTWKGDQDTDLITLPDFKFDDSLGGGDLQLVSSGDGEDIFHMVEIVRGGGFCGPLPGPELVFLPGIRIDP